MDDLLHLTADERPLFDALPDDVKGAWEGKLAEETLDAYETPEQLAVRLSVFDDQPEVKRAVDAVFAALKDGASPDAVELPDMPEEVVPRVLFALGAGGMSALLQILLRSATADSLEGIAALSQARHLLLEQNAAAHVVFQD